MDLNYRIISWLLYRFACANIVENDGLSCLSLCTILTFIQHLDEYTREEERIQEDHNDYADVVMIDRSP